jgi:hypothetical protein
MVASTGRIAVDFELLNKTRSHMTTREEYQRRMQAQLDEWSADINKFAARAEKKKIDARVEYDERLKDLKDLREKARTKLAELKNAGDDKWENLKVELEHTWNSLRDALKATPTESH